MKLGKVTIFGIVLFFLLWTEETQAGLTFLSPADMQKIAGRQSQNKLRHANMNRREVEDGLDEEQREMGVMIPVDASMKLAQKQAAVMQDYLYPFLSISSRTDPEDKKEDTQSK